MKKINIKYLVLILIVLFITNCVNSYDKININNDGKSKAKSFGLEAGYCGDGSCSKNQGETILNCAIDCVDPIRPGSSPVIKSIKVEGNPITFNNTWGDLWMNTWADDNNIYSSWGDGFGFGGVGTDVGVALIEGTLPYINGVNVFVDHTTIPPTCNTTRCKEPDRPFCCIENDDKPSSLLFINKTLYAMIHSPLGDAHVGYLAYSNNYGKNWIKYKETSPWTKDVNSTFRCMFFINMGKNYELNTDGYVYTFGIGREWNWNKGIYLARVKKEKILDYNEYEYLRAVDSKNNPLWSKFQFKAKPLPNIIISEQVSAMYHPEIKRYLLLSNTGLYDAPNPWGPWSYAGTWIRDGWFGYQPGIISKDVGSNSFWFTIAGKQGYNISYQLNIGKMIIELR